MQALDSKEVAQPDHPLFVYAKLLALENQNSGAHFNERIQSVLAALPHVTPGALECCEPESFGDFSRSDFAGWSVRDEAFGSCPGPAGDFVVGDSNRPVAAVPQ